MSKEQLEEIKYMIDLETEYNVINTLNVWSNGVKIRRYQGQGEGNNNSPEKGFRKMVAVLIEADE